MIYNIIIKNHIYYTMNYNIISNNNQASQTIENKIHKVMQNHTLNAQQFEILFILGGDGFFLNEFQKVHNLDIKVIFINTGTLGFYAFGREFNEEHLNLLNDESKFIHLDMLQAEIDNHLYFATNDFAFSNNHTTCFDVKVNDVFVESFFGNGFLVSTNFGSTARNKSLGGPIVFPDMHAMIFNEVEPIQNKYHTSLESALVINHDATIEVSVVNRTKNNGVFLCDGREINNHNNKIDIKIRMCLSKAKVLISQSIAAYAKKLNYALIEKE